MHINFGFASALLVSLLALAACGPGTADPIAVSPGSDGIVDATEVDLNKQELAPNVVALRITTDQGKQTICSGTFIGDRVILTAAHCIYDLKGKSLVRPAPSGADPVGPSIAVLSLFKRDDQGRVTSKSYPVETIVVHEKYAPKVKRTLDSFNYDVGLIKLASPWDPNAYRGRKLVKARIARENLLSLGQKVLAMGFGFGDSAKKIFGFGYEKAGLGVLRQKMFVVRDRLKVARRTGFITEKDIVVVESSNGPEDGGLCQGDSGGPSFVRKNGLLYIVGITSYGTEDCHGADALMSVPMYANWIDAVAARWRTQLY